LGYPVTDETGTSDDIGRFNNFQRGSIYWTPQTDAHEVHGRIRDAWLNALGPNGFGFPTSDEMPIPNCDGRVSRFQRGSIYWTPRGSPQGDTQTVYGDNGSGPPPSDICPGPSSGGGGSGQNQATVTIQLVRQPVFEGSIPYGSRFPTLGSINGNLIRVTNPSPNITLRFPKLNHTTANGNIAADVISLGTGAATSTQELSQIFGSGSPSLPVTFVSCVITAGPVPDSVLLSVMYSYTP
jgi:hypothetical protein